MKAVVIHRFGGPEVLEVAELDAPEPMAGQVRIHVQAAAVNPVDIATRAGWLADRGLLTRQRANRHRLGSRWCRSTRSAPVSTASGPAIR